MEKGGGRGFSLPGKTPRSHRSAASKDVSMKGKDDSSTKSKRGKKVQFDSEGSSEDEFDFPSKSDNLSKGGKGRRGDKVAHGGKTPVTKEPDQLELKIESELPEHAKCLMDCEAAQMLQGIQEQMVLLSQDPTIKIPVSFDKGLRYAKTCAHYTNPNSVRRILETLKSHGVSDGEICVIANVCPETVDEVFALVPSFKSKQMLLKEPLMSVLSELAELKRSE